MASCIFTGYKMQAVLYFQVYKRFRTTFCLIVQNNFKEMRAVICLVVVFFVGCTKELENQVEELKQANIILLEQLNNLIAVNMS